MSDLMAQLGFDVVGYDDMGRKVVKPRGGPRGGGRGRRPMPVVIVPPGGGAQATESTAWMYGDDDDDDLGDDDDDLYGDDDDLEGEIDDAVAEEEEDDDMVSIAAVYGDDEDDPVELGRNMRREKMRRQRARALNRAERALDRYETQKSKGHSKRAKRQRKLVKKWRGKVKKLDGALRKADTRVRGKKAARSKVKKEAAAAGTTVAAMTTPGYVAGAMNITPQLDVPAPGGKQTVIPMKPSATPAGDWEGATSSPLMQATIPGVAPAYGITAGLQLESEDVPWMKYQIMGMICNFAGSLAATMLVEDLKPGGAGNILPGEGQVSASPWYANARQPVAGLRANPVIESPNKAYITIYVAGTAAQVAQVSVQLVVNIVTDDLLGRTTYGPQGSAYQNLSRTAYK